MPSEESKILQGILKPLLKSAGYKKTSSTWYNNDGFAIRVLNLQRSKWSPAFYVNLGIYVLELGDKQKPHEADCHIRERLHALVDWDKHPKDIFDFEIEMSMDYRTSVIEEQISELALPWLEAKASIEGMRDYLLKEKKHGLPVFKEVWSYLGLEQP